MKIETTLELRRTLRISLYSGGGEGRVIRGDQDQEARRARSPTFSSNRPACAHSDSNWQSPAQRRKTLSLPISRRRIADSVPRLFRGSPGQPSLGFRGSCLTIFGDASEGCTSYRTIASPKVRNLGPNEPSVPGEVSIRMRRWWLSEISRGAGHR
jgi:hypothetical protein